MPCFVRPPVDIRVVGNDAALTAGVRLSLQEPVFGIGVHLSGSGTAKHYGNSTSNVFEAPPPRFPTAAAPSYVLANGAQEKGSSFPTSLPTLFFFL